MDRLIINMVKLSASEAAEKWKRRLQGATADIARGIERVTESPTKKAAQNIDKMKAKLDEAFANGKVKAGLESVDVNDWKRDALAGVSRIAQGAESKGESKMNKFMDVALPHIEAGQRKVESMPDLTFEDSISRQTAFSRHMHNLKYKK